MFTTCFAAVSPDGCRKAGVPDDVIPRDSAPVFAEVMMKITAAKTIALIGNGHESTPPFKPEIYSEYYSRIIRIIILYLRKF